VRSTERPILGADITLDAVLALIVAEQSLGC
jgi:hypothetical protein